MSVSDTSLRRLYEDSATPLSSGLGRAVRQATMLASIASASGRRMTVVDVGCGGGMCTEVAMNVCNATPNASARMVGLDWSWAALSVRQSREAAR